MKNIAQLVTLFALSNLWMVRSKLKGRRDESLARRGETLQGLKSSPMIARNGATLKDAD
jgi:hypothetical protein